MPNPAKSHGGKRPGAGRPPREDGRKLPQIRVALTEGEYLSVLALTVDERRKALLAAVEAKN